MLDNIRYLYFGFRLWRLTGVWHSRALYDHMLSMEPPK